MKKLKLKLGEIAFLKQFTRKGHKSVRALKRANILLLIDKGETGNSISEKLNVNRDTVYNVKKRYFKEGLDVALSEKPRSGQPVKYNDKKKSEIIAYACTNPPKGRKRWTIRILAEELSKKSEFKTINRETIRLVLKKAIRNLG